MNQDIFAKKQLLAFAVAAAMSALSASTFAGGFQLFEQNAADIGLAGAGVAMADDASTAFLNPAGMVRLKVPEISISGDEVFTHIKFSGSNILDTSSQTLKSPFFGAKPFTQSGSVQGGTSSFVPAVHFVVPIPEYHLAAGFSVAAPYGLDTSYGVNDFTRYSATASSITDIDYSPSLAFQFTKQFSVAAGVDPQFIKASFDSMAGLPVLNPAPVPPFSNFRNLPQNVFDSLSRNRAETWAYGWHAGAMWQFDPHTRLGFLFRSATHANLSGSSNFHGLLANGLVGLLTNPSNLNRQLTSDGLTANIVLPETISFGAYHELNDRWAIMGSAVKTQWHQLRQLTLNNITGVDNTGAPTSSLSQTTNFNWHNTWRLALGTQYHYNQKWAFRTGIAYDESPIPSSTRSIRLPDARRIILGLGANYQATKKINVDVGYSHLFINDGHVNVTQTTGSLISTSIGTAKNSVDIVGIQLNVKLA